MDDNAIKEKRLLLENELRSLPPTLEEKEQAQEKRASKERLVKYLIGYMIVFFLFAAGFATVGALVYSKIDVACFDTQFFPQECKPVFALWSVAVIFLCLCIAPVLGMGG